MATSFLETTAVVFLFTCRGKHAPRQYLRKQSIAMIAATIMPHIRR